MRMKVLYFWSLLAFISLITLSCNEELYDTRNEGKAVTYIKKAYKDGLYDKAIEYAGEFKTRYPYAGVNVEIDLIIADSYYKLGEYLEATIHYHRFVKLYPKNPKRPYALFRIGMCHWKESSSAIDREQASTAKALKAWRKLLSEHPQSSFALQAKELIQKGEKRVLASKKFIASFYCRQKIWHACAYRALEIADSFPAYKKERKKALLLAEKAFRKLAHIKRKAENGKKKLEDNLYFRDDSSSDLERRAKKARQEADTL